MTNDKNTNRFERGRRQDSRDLQIGEQSKNEAGSY